MCGIAGMVSFGAPFTESATLRRMCDACAHRGPDDEGYAFIDRDLKKASVCFGNDTAAGARTAAHIAIGDHTLPFTIGLGHRRFSIIDLSAGGHQPFFDHTGRWCMIYNGEVYNYREIRDILAQKGARFVSSSDTEVVLEAYKFWGADCFPKFNGFWALAIYDRQNDSLVLSRDRVGKKPLFYTRSGDRIYFASEIKALLTVDAVGSTGSVNDEAVWNWLAYGKKNLGDETFFEGIHLFPKASFALVSRDGRCDPVTYWQLPRRRRTSGDISVSQACTALKDMLYDAVALRMRSDVPVALELSGGIDSSVIAAAAATTANKLPAFTVRFPDPHNEEPFARLAADHLGIDLHVIEPRKVNFWEHIGAFTLLEEEPYHSPNLFTNQESWLAMRRTGIKVSLNGAGGDELFGGYPSSFWNVQMELLAQRKLRPFCSNAAHYSEQNNPLMRLAGFIPYAGARSFVDRFPLLGKPYKVHVPHKSQKYLRTPLALSQRLLSDMERTLMPYWLVSGDRGYMGIPIEIREPLLDYRIVEFAFSLPAEYLVRDGWHKWILRKAFEKELPHEVIWRRRKMGFPFPLNTFLQESRAILSCFSSTNNPFLTLRRPLHHLDWKTISFIIWYEYFINGNRALFDAIEKEASAGAVPGHGFRAAYLNDRAMN